MDSRRLLLIICFHAMLFQTKALQRFHRDAEGPGDGDGELDELREDIRNHHLNSAFKFDIPGHPSSKAKRKIKGFAPKSEKTCWLSRRCFTDMSSGFRSHPLSFPYVSKWWNSAPDPWWPEYGWTDGFGYPLKGSCNLPGFGTWNQPYPYPYPYPCHCGKWCSECYTINCSIFISLS